MRTRLCELALLYGTDKCPEWRDNTGHAYTPFYADLFLGMKVRRVLEIGICDGASLRMWRDYFEDADVWGIDNDPNRLIEGPRIHSVLCDAGDKLQLASFITYCHNHDLTFDLIIDDGSHKAADQVLAANSLIPLVTPGGIYVIEDVQQGSEWIKDRIYWPSWMVALNVAKRSDDRLLVVRR